MYVVSLSAFLLGKVLVIWLPFLSAQYVPVCGNGKVPSQGGIRTSVVSIFSPSLFDSVLAGNSFHCLNVRSINIRLKIPR